MSSEVKSKMRIKSAAIRYKDEVYTGKSHSEIGLKMVRDGICEKPYPFGDDQGFITECGKYLRRAPSLMIAIRAGQVEIGKTIDSKHLFSEDLHRMEGCMENDSMRRKGKI